MTWNQFLALSNSVFKVIRGKNYSKVGIIFKVNNEIVVETWIAKRYVADLYSILLKDPSSYVKTKTCFTFWGLVLQNRIIIS